MIKHSILVVFALVTFASSCKKDDNGDKNKPFINVLGSNPMYWSQGSSPFIDFGAEAWDVTENNDTINIDSRLQVTDNVDVNTTGDYTVRFNVTDEAGNAADEKTRLVKVILTK
jgi:hypothetical protein